MNDPLRIDLALARAAGLPARSANDASASLPPAATALAASPDALFSPLALLLARFLPTHGAPAPVPTPEEARLLHDYLQQRVVAVLHAADTAVAPAMRVTVAAAGGLHLAPAPGPGDVVTPILHRDGDIVRLVDVLRRALPAPPESEARVLAATTAHDPAPRASSIEGPDPRRAWWPWRMTADPAGEHTGFRFALTLPLYLGVAVALLLGWWLAS